MWTLFSVTKITIFFEHNTGTGLWDQGAILVMIWKGCETIPTMLLLLGLNWATSRNGQRRSLKAACSVPSSEGLLPSSVSAVPWRTVHPLLNYTEMLVLFWVFLISHHGWIRSFTNGQLTPAADVLAFFLVNQNSGILSFQSKPFSHKGSTLMWFWSLLINLAAFSVFYIKLSSQKPLCAFIAICPHFSFTLCREILLRKKKGKWGLKNWRPNWKAEMISWQMHNKL